MVPRRVLHACGAAAIAFSLALPACAVDLSGSWSGSWRSCTTGHAGVLEARFTKCDDTRYHVVFSGRFFRILPFRYTVTLDVVEDTGDRVTLAGSSFLGRLFGTFRYTATADQCHFAADYTSRRDRGEFSLRRVGH